jgi:hypothetical protein
VKEKLGLAVEEGTTAQLRELAGGERKVGEFFSGVVKFLAAHAALIGSHEWSELVIVPALSEDALYKELRRLKAESIANEEERAAEFKQRKAELEEMISSARASMDEAKASKAQLEILMQRVQRVAMEQEKTPPA